MNGQIMIVVTEAARKKMGEIRAATGQAKAGLRIEVRGGCCSPSYHFTLVEAPAKGDTRVEVEGISIYFDPTSAVKLFNVEIDHDGSRDEKGFVVKERYATC